MLNNLDAFFVVSLLHVILYVSCAGEKKRIAKSAAMEIRERLILLLWQASAT